MAVGTYLIHFSDLKCSFWSDVEYDDQLEKYISRQRVQCTGSVEDEQRSLLINGSKSLHGLTCFLTIERGEAWPLEKADTRQTRRNEPFPKPAFVSKTIGTLDYEPGERGIERGLYACICLTEDAFTDLWQAGLHGKRIAAFAITVFGQPMRQLDSIGSTSYEWEIVQEGSASLLLCGFSFFYN